MTNGSAALTIPHRDSRKFVHGADIYQTCLREVGRQFLTGQIHEIFWRFHRPLGSKVTAQILSPPFPTKNADAEMDFQIGGKSYQLVVNNSPGQVQMAETYHFDEEQVRPALVEDCG